jgi:predicted PhzF superfamily epimerase YddE/YHI9
MSATQSLPIVQVDAFTAEPFKGNPAAVCLLSSARDAAWMQKVALEMNLSETAFLVPREDGFDLRWFTPATEVALCGHATLASAHVLWEGRILPPSEQARFHTKSGVLTADKIGDWIELDFPATPETPATPPEGLLDALGVAATYVGRSRFDYLVEVAVNRSCATSCPTSLVCASCRCAGSWSRAGAPNPAPTSSRVFLRRPPA